MSEQAQKYSNDMEVWSNNQSLYYHNFETAHGPD